MPTSIINAALAPIHTKLDTIIKQGVQMNAKLQEISDELDMIKANVLAANETNAAVVADLKDQVAALQAKLAAGDFVSADDLNAVDAKADEIITIQTS